MLYSASLNTEKQQQESVTYFQSRIRKRRTHKSDLKSQVIKRLQKSLVAKLEALILATDRGDRKPSEYLRDLKAMIQPHASGTIADSLVRRALLKSLPSQLQIILDTVSASQTLEEMAAAADSALERSPRMVESVSLDSGITSELAELRSELAALRMNQGQNRTNAKDRPKRQTHDKNGICFYHQKFKAKAHKCIQPCKFKSDQEN